LPALALAFAIPDHPWVDSANGAAVRIAMTVGAHKNDVSLYDAPDVYALADVYASNGRLLTVLSETTVEEGEVAVTLAERWGEIHADLSIGANVASAVALLSNAKVSSPGVKLHGAGFIVTAAESTSLLPLTPGEGSGEGSAAVGQIIREYRNGRDLTDAPRGVKVIDLFGLQADEVRSQFPAIYQRLLERVKPERDQNNRATYRDNWWIFGEPRRDLRPALSNLPRYIVTVETAKHRTFQFLDASILPDNKLIAIALSDAFDLGILSSRVHVAWALAAGSWLGVGNDPVYVKSRCFETFPFPDEDTGLTAGLRENIGNLAEQIDAHRKRALTPTISPGERSPGRGLTLTGMYNVLDALREGRQLTTKEKAIHTDGLVGLLKDLHDELDAAVLQAYGLPVDIATDALLTRLVVLNVQRAAEEKTGKIRWLRPVFQNPSANPLLSNQERTVPVFRGQQVDLALNSEQNPAATASNANAAVLPWPSSLPDQVRALAQTLASHPGPLTLGDIEARFKGRGPWKKGLPRILKTLEALGRARREGEAWASH
ncbi:MAG: type IIL restriction-modification enzyme MmeI, partial [Polaromonas sp.]